jgi:hypothetical protein
MDNYVLQVVLSQLTLAPESDSYLRDEEGSGSGHPPVTQWIDDGEPEDPNWPDEGSASGDNPLPPRNITLIVSLQLLFLIPLTEKFPIVMEPMNYHYYHIIQPPYS